MHRIVPFLIATRRGLGFFLVSHSSIASRRHGFLFQIPTASSLQSGRLFKPYDWVVGLMLGWVGHTSLLLLSPCNRIRRGNKGEVGTRHRKTEKRQL